MPFEKNPKGIVREEILSLGELEALTSTGSTVFLTLSSARIASQVTEGFQFATDLFVLLNEGSADAEACCDRLTFDPAAFYADDHIALVRHAEFLKRCHDLVALKLEREVLFKRASIDVDNSRAAAEADG